MASWPAGIPQKFDQDQFSYKPEDNLIRSDMEMGPEKTRPRFTASRTFISGSMEMTVAEWTTLLSFYESTLVYGSLEFDWSDPVDGTNASFRFREPPGIVSTRGDLFTVSINVEQMP